MFLVWLLSSTMKGRLAILALIFAAVAAFPHLSSLVMMGGENASITKYPEIAALLYSTDGKVFTEDCAGVILTTNAVLTSANCLEGTKPENWKIRVGSADPNNGGTVYTISRLFPHPDFNKISMVYDIALIYTTDKIVYGDAVKPATIAGSSYKLGDESNVWAAGWGAEEGQTSTKLQQVELYTVNQGVCKSKYKTIKKEITDNMLCAGVQGGEKGHCDGDSGSPLYHRNNVVVGIYSWSHGCGLPNFSGVYTRISVFHDWIQNNLV